MSQPSNDGKPLNAEETRAFVTPYAFGVSAGLLGTPLATPAKRGLAILLDLLVIALLTEVNSLLLAALSAWAFLRAQRRLRKNSRFEWGRRVLRGLAALMIFILALGLFEAFKPEQADVGLDDGQVVSGVEGLKVLGYTAKHMHLIAQTNQRIEDGECQSPMQCWSPAAEALVDDLAGLPLATEQAMGLMTGFLEEASGLAAGQRQALLAQMQARYAAAHSLAVSEASKPSQQSMDSIAPNTQDAAAGHDGNQGPEAPRDALAVPPKAYSQKQDNQPPSVVAWAKGIAADLGIGVGWAAFYFTVFTAWWQGQTPGKKLFGIKVVKLDGGTLNLWESFGRYGGYGAGLATGLLGFLQIYWDANRQTIQDKISETLVIDLRKPKLALTREQVARLSDTPSP